VVAFAKNVNPMDGLYQRLSAVGLNRPYVKAHILPSWWQDEAAGTPVGYSQALMILARNLGLDLGSLRDGSAELRLGGGIPSKLKKSKDATDGDLAATRSIALQVAQLAALAGGQVKDLGGPLDAREIRQRILDQGSRYVDLESLLDFAWSIGLPVIHVSNFPTGLKRMHGLSAIVDGRSVIVICKDQRQPAWLLFILAHEIGHIALRHHEGGNQALVDERIDEESQDAEEIAANAFALELLTGNPKYRVRATGTWPNAHQLAASALRMGQEQGVDPGHIILNYAHSMNRRFFGVANAALKIVSPHADAPALIRQKMVANLDWSALPADASEFLVRMTQASPDAASGA
jgi:hypothetical protein